ncbi:MAG: pyridoxal phosphate-dependent aminotransferase [Patescibacteria group bacterium]|nr:pyridoxal phosphate-dependent aminotransferase [Patescibacteria group bacterium]
MNSSLRIRSMPVSAVRKLAPYATAAKQAGATVFHLNIGDPDVKTPEAMLAVLRNWDRNPIGYAPSPGEPAFLRALESYYHGLGFGFLTESDIVATVGGSEAIIMALFSVCEPGDEVLVFEPFYSNYASLAAMADVRFVAVPTTLQTGFHLPERTQIEQRITGRTKAILFCTPGNPTGTVFTRTEMEMLVTIAKERNLFLISDEVYREYIFTGAPKHTSILHFMESLPDRTIMLDSLSKRYSLCGARLGVFVSRNPELVQGAVKIAQSRLSGGLIDQLVGAALTEVPQSFIAEVQREYESRRDILYTGLTAIPGVTMTRPEGAFYSMVGLPVPDAEQFCIWLLEKYRSEGNATVMLAPGTGFYLTPGKGKSEVRIAYVLNTSDLKTCITMLADALEQYPERIR